MQAAIGGLEQRLRQKLELLDGRAAHPTPCSGAEIRRTPKAGYMVQ